MDITILTKTEIAEIIEETEKRAALEIISYQPPEIMTMKEVCEYLSVSASTIRKCIKNSGFPVSEKFGDKRFVRSDILAWLSEK